MKYLIILLAFVGCTPAPKVVPEEPKKQIEIRRHRPNPHPIKRMICHKRPAVVAVIDTGFTFSDKTIDPHLCSFGHKDFTQSQQYSKVEGLHDPIPYDNHGHGTNVAGIIQEYAKKSNYCIVVIKYFEPRADAEDNMLNTVKAFQYATNIGAKYINYSGGGMGISDAEKAAVERFLDKGGRLIAAAGNEKQDVSEHPYYPAMYDSRIVSVGSMTKEGFVAPYSNYGKDISRWEYGTDVVGFGIKMSGTSQATAIATGKIVNESECDK